MNIVRVSIILFLLVIKFTHFSRFFPHLQVLWTANPDPVCPERLDPDPVNITPDPKPRSLHFIPFTTIIMRLCYFFIPIYFFIGIFCVVCVCMCWCVEEDQQDCVFPNTILSSQIFLLLPHRAMKKLNLEKLLLEKENNKL